MFLECSSTQTAALARSTGRLALLCEFPPTCCSYKISNVRYLWLLDEYNVILSECAGLVCTSALLALSMHASILLFTLMEQISQLLLSGYSIVGECPPLACF